MMPDLLNIFKPFLTEILAGLGAFIGGLILYFKGANDAKNKIKRIKAEKAYEDLQTRENIEDSISNNSDDVNSGMLDDWNRDKK